MKHLFVWIFIALLSVPAWAEPHVVMVTPRGETAMEQTFRQELLRRVGPVKFTLIKPDLGNAADMSRLAAQVRSLNPTLIYAWGTPTTLALAGPHDAPVIADIPIVFTVVADPLRARLVKELRNPRRNVTGASHLAPLTVQLSAMREFKPFKTLGVVYNPREPNIRFMLEDLAAEAKQTGVQLIIQTVDLNAAGQPDPASIAVKIKLLKAQGSDWLYIGPDSFVGFTHRKLVTQASIEAKLPSFTANESAIRDGAALFGVFSPADNLARFTAIKASQILKNERKVADIPIETLQRFSTVINLCTAIKLKVFPPPSLFKLADIIVPVNGDAGVEEAPGSSPPPFPPKECVLP